MFHSTSERRVHTRGLTGQINNIQFSRISGKKSPICVLKIPSAIASSARIIIGDRIDILVDSENNRVAIVRSNSGGWKIGSHKKTSYLKTSFTEFPGGVRVSSEKKTSIIPRYEITDLGIVFDMPPSLIIKA